MSQLKILIVTFYFPPQNSIASQRPNSWAQTWSKAGNDITVLTIAKTDTKEFTQNLGYDCYKVPTAKLTQIIRSSVSKSGTNPQTFESKFSIKKIAKFIFRPVIKFINRRGINNSCRFPDVDDLWVNGALDWAKDRGPWDIAVCTIGPYSTLYIGYLLKRKHLVNNLVADYRDLWVKNRHFKGIFPFTILEKYMENKMLKTTDMVTTVSHGFATILHKEYPFIEPIVFTNGYDQKILDSVASENYFQLDNVVRIIYTGSIYYPIQDPSMLFEVVREYASTKDLQNFQIVFAGPNVSLISQLILEYDLEKWVKLEGMLSRKDALKLQNNADVLLMLDHEGDSEDGVIPGKLYEYLKSEAPIWALGITDNKEAGQIIKKANAGLMFGYDKILLKKALNELLEHPRRKVSKNQQFIKSFSRTAIATDYLNILEKNFGSQ